MRNVVLSMLAKISHIDAGMKQLTARVEAQSLLSSALVLAVSREGGVTDMIEALTRPSIPWFDSAELLKSDAAILLGELQALLSISTAVDRADDEINHQALDKLTGVTSLDGQ